MRVNRLKWLLVVLTVFVLFACSDTGKDTVDPNTIRIGAIAGAELRLMQAVKEVAAKKYDLHIQLVLYPTLKEINKALADKEIDADVLQNRIAVAFNQKKYNYHFAQLGLSYIYPMGIYSKKIKSVLQIPKGATIIIPNEPTNEARALLLLEKAGLIRMASDENKIADVSEIVANPNNFKIIALPAREVAGALTDADAAVINISFALPSGLVPAQDTLVIENADPNYASVVTVREGEEDEPRMKALLEVLRSPEVQKAANQIFHGQAVPAWK